MLAIQIRAHAMLIASLLLVDAAAFHGAYRQWIGGHLLSTMSAASPTHWGGSGRDWRNPGKPRS